MNGGNSISRREFIKATAGVAIGAALAGPVSASASDESEESRFKKAVVLSMVPEMPSVEDRLKIASAAGFDGIEAPPIYEPDQLAVMRQAAEKTGIEIHSIIFGGWHAPLSSPDTAIAEKGAAELAGALKCAKELGADTVLLVPAVVNQNTRYVEAYERSQKHLRALAPEAEKLGVIIAVENVWNNFLLSPLEFARYIDEIDSPYVQAYFDVGNVVAFGWPEDWIRTLGPRIKKVHLKDFKRGPREWCNLGEGDVNWLEVRKALMEIGYKGYLTAELKGGDEAYLRDVSERMSRIAAGT